MNVVEITSSAEVSSIPAFINAVILVSSTAISEAVLDDSSDGTGDTKIRVKSPANDSKVVFLGEKGVVFSTAVYATLSGTGAKLYVYYR